MQHDLDCANAAGAAYRGDVNDALQALGTLNSGASAPSTMYANMLWADTTNNVLKRRNNANTAWIVIDSLDNILSESVTTHTIGVDDIGKLFSVDTSAAARTVAFAAMSTLTGRFKCVVQNDNSAGNDVTLDPDGSETINGASTMAVPDGFAAFIFSNAAVDGLEAVLVPIANAVRTDVVNVFTKQQYNATQTLTDGASISWDLNTSPQAQVTLAGNRTLANPSNMKDGAVYSIEVIQDATGSRTLAYGSAYKFPSGTAPTLSTAANARDLLSFKCDGTYMLGVTSGKAFA